MAVEEVVIHGEKVKPWNPRNPTIPNPPPSNYGGGEGRGDMGYNRGGKKKKKKKEEAIDPFKDPENPMEEVYVYGKYPLLSPLDFLGSGSNPMGPYWGEVIDRFVLPYINRYIEEEMPYVREQLNEWFKTETKAALERYDDYTAYSYNPPAEGLPRDGVFMETPYSDAINKVGPYWDEIRRRNALMEHVHVTAPRLTRSGNIIQDITFGPDWIKGFQYREVGVLPRDLLRGEMFKNEVPDQRTYGSPNSEPLPPNPMPELPKDRDYVPEYRGSMAITLTPNNGLAFNLRLTPREGMRRPEAHKLRKDRKAGKAAKVYRAVLMMVTRTYGTYTELRDLWEAIAWNIKIDGKFLIHHKDPLTMLKLAFLDKKGMIINWRGMALDLALMQGMDHVIGRTARIGRRALNQMNYYGPNPGSYTPNFGEIEYRGHNRG